MKTIILAYTLRTDLGDTDHYEVFFEGEDNLKDANQRLLELQDLYYESETELYSWNIAQLISTSEHYE